MEKPGVERAPDLAGCQRLKDHLVAEHKMRKLTLVDKNLANQLVPSKVPNGLEDQGKFRKMSLVVLIVVMVLLVASWAALAWWLPGLVSVPAAVAGAFWSCVMLAVAWYFVVEPLTTD